MLTYFEIATRPEPCIVHFMDKNFTVYMATNTVNGKRYVGATRRTLEMRQYQHYNDAKKNRKGCRIFAAAIRKYGEDAFEWSVLSTVDTEDELMKEEIRLISELKPEYNITIGGQGIIGVPRTPEWRANMSKGLKGRASAMGMLGKNHTQEFKDRMSAVKKAAAKRVRIPIDDVVALQKRVKEIYSYDPLTGIFTRLNYSGYVNQHQIGNSAGHIEKNGKIHVGVDSRKFLAHRLAWLYVYGEWPSKDLAHKNKDNSDNRISNLCIATETELRASSKINANNFLGVKGVRLHECGKYVARICKNGKSHYLGLFDTVEEASSAYQKKAKELFGDFARSA